MSLEILKSELDLFKKPSFQASIDHSQIIQYRPTSALTETSTIEFDIPVAADEYLDLQNVFLATQGKLVQQDGTDFPQEQDNRYSLTNYASNTIYDQINTILGGTLTSQSANSYGYLAIIEALTQNNLLSISTFLRSAGFILPKSDVNYNFDSVDENLAKIYNRSKIFTLFGRIHNAIFNSDKLLLNGVPLRIQLTRASPQFYAMGSPAQAAPNALAATQPKLHLIDVSLYVRKVKLSPNILSAHAKALQISKAIYPIKRSVVKVLNLPQAQSSFVLDNVFMGQLPFLVIYGLVSNDAFTGSYTSNPFAFKNYDLAFTHIDVNGESYPKTPYEPDYRDNNEKYEREYFDFFLNLGYTQSKNPPPIDFLNFKKGINLYAINLNPDFDNPNENEYTNIPKDGFLNIILRFRNNLVNALKLICYAQFNNYIEIDENRNVTTDYS